MIKQTPLVFLATIISLGGFLFGFDAAIISGVGGLAVREFGVGDLEFGVLVGAPSLAGILGGLLVGPLSDLIGRRLVLLIVAALYMASAALSAFAPDFQWLVWGRALGGFAFASLVLAPLYIAEIAPADQRGRLVSINQLNIVIGFAVAYFTSYYLLIASQGASDFVQAIGLAEHNWRWMLGVELIPATIYFLCLLGVPESPRWLMVRNREDKARAVLSRLYDQTRIDAVIEEIRDQIAKSREESRTPFHVFLKPGMRTLIFIGLIVAVAQQITGINAVYFYAQTIFELAGAGTNAAFAQATAIGAVNIVFTLIAMALIDRVGRKPLLIVGLAGVVLSMALTAYGFQQASYFLGSDMMAALPEGLDPDLVVPLVGQTYASDVDFRRALEATLGTDLALQYRPELTRLAISINAPLVLIGLLGFVASFAVSLGPVMWVLLSEIFPNRVRGLAMSAVTFTNSGVSAAVQVAFPVQLAQLGAAITFGIYAAFGVVFLILVMRFVPETKQRSLEELERQAS